MYKMFIAVALSISLLCSPIIFAGKEVRNYTTRHVVDGKVYVHHYHYVHKGPDFRYKSQRLGKPGHYEYHYHYYIRK